MITGICARILAQNRSRYNARFADARHFYPLLDAARFADHLTKVVAPILSAVEAIAPQQVEHVADELYDLSLDLVGREFLGSNSRYPAINAAWQSLLPRMPALLAEDPRRLAGAVTNAVHSIAREPGARPLEWIAMMQRLAPGCSDLKTLLELGQVAAWRTGMAHYRLSALRICRDLDPSLVEGVLGLPSTTEVKILPDILHHLESNPWYDPTLGLDTRFTPSSLEITRRAGGFRGFGGYFLSLPQVTGSDGTAFLIQENGRTWRLYADLFGAVLVRGEPTVPVDLSPWQPRFRLTIGGKVQAHHQEKIFPELRNISGSADNGSTLAVSTQFSHWIYLVAEVTAFNGKTLDGNHQPFFTNHP